MRETGSLFRRVFASVVTPFAVAQVSALDSSVKAFAILFYAPSLLAIAAPFVGEFGLLSSNDFELVRESIRISLKDGLPRPFPLFLELGAVAALVALTFGVAEEALRETLAVHQKTLRLRASTYYFLLDDFLFLVLEYFVSRYGRLVAE